MNDTFAAKAANWDNPDKVKMTKKFVSELLFHINLLPTWKALELGTGTGLVGLQIESFVKKLVLEDTSESMLEVLRQKLDKNSKVEILHGEIFDYKQQDIDLIFSAMAFHHLPDIEKTLQHLATITKPGAWVVIGDLVTEDGSFHNFDPIPHCGFDTTVLSKQFVQAGFEVKLVKIYNVITRITNDTTSDYEQFMLIAKRL
ncbi:MAG: class I SAM-dependent methyltransferase [Bacteroidota bacterium]|nr:class I SAM-dependent methyltransferase [Bacteroidota bacterium]